MNKQHKWHKEIKAWADGAEIEARYNYPNQGWTEWQEMSSTCRFYESFDWEYRIKPQPKEPKYLYVYNDGSLFLFNYKIKSPSEQNIKYIGKIKLEDYDGDA